MSKDIYLIAKAEKNSIPVPEFACELEQRGHNILFKWWEGTSPRKPYLDYPAQNGPLAKKMLEAAFYCDVAIAFTDHAMLGASAEFGAAAASTTLRTDKEVVVVHPPNERQSIFYTHPGVIVVEGLAEVRSRDWY